MITETRIDKADWGDGPWQSEPNKKLWHDAETGLPCLALRSFHCGHWSGYVGVPADHPWHGKAYDDEMVGPCTEVCSLGWHYDCTPSGLVEVHGGLTFSAASSPGMKPDAAWWFGFDCAHAGDLLPRHNKLLGRSAHGEYRNLAYVKAECAKLARQLAAAVGGER